MNGLIQFIVCGICIMYQELGTNKSYMVIAQKAYRILEKQDV